MTVPLLISLFVCVILHKQIDCCTVNISCDRQDANECFCSKRGLLVDGKTHRIRDDQMNASSSWAGYGPHKARLSNVDACWVSANGALHDQWIQFNLSKPWTIVAIVTRGRHHTRYNQFVTSYKVTYAASTWHYTVGAWQNALYMPAAEITQDAMVFPGNHDKDTLQVNELHEPIKAQYVRIHPLKYNRYISMRADVIGCF